jgi:hypothetical protein
MANKEKWDHLIETTAQLSTQVADNSRSTAPVVEPKHRPIFEKQSQELLDAAIALSTMDPSLYPDSTVDRTQQEVDQAMNVANPLTNADRSVVENHEAISWLHRLT